MADGGTGQNSGQATPIDEPNPITPPRGQQVSTSFVAKAALSAQPRGAMPHAFKTPQPRKVTESFQSTAVSRLNTAARANSVSREAGIRSVDRSFVKRDTPSDVADNVKILVRVRPFNEQENNLGEHSCLALRSEQRLSLLPHSDNSQYTFDHVLKDDTTQSKVFEVAGRGVVDNCLDGYNSCVFAYGQTGSGKTHTMLGQLTQRGSGEVLGAQAGLTPRIFEHILKEIDARKAAAEVDDGVVWECRVSFLEIYNECITDLLNPEATQLAIREDLQHGIYVEGVTEQHVLTVGDALAILQAGTQNRHVGETRMNRESSRSHCVLTASLSSRSTRHGISNTRSSRLNLVDLAGSEQQKASGASGERLREASNINKSLSILGRVINTLAERQRGLRHVHHIPYRDSKLTFLLQDSLGGNSKTVMIANVSPSTHSIGETLSTLRFAQRAKRMGNRAHINEDTSGDAQMLRQEVMRLKMQIAAMHAEGPHAQVPALILPPATPPVEAKSPAADYCYTPATGIQALRKEHATAVSPHATAVKALVDAVERAQAAEQVSALQKQKCDALEALLAGYEKEKLKKQMVDKFREAQMKKLEQAVQSKRPDSAQELVTATITSLKAKVAHAEAQRESAKREAAAANAKTDEMRQRLIELQSRYKDDEEGHTTLQAQLQNLQDVLLACRMTPPSTERQTNLDGSLLDGLHERRLRIEDLSCSSDLMSRGLETLALSASRNLEHGLSILEEERSKHTAALEELRAQHARDTRTMRDKLASYESLSMQQQSDSDRTHEELLTVRQQLAEQVARNDELWHRLQPAQSERRALESRVAELMSEVDDLQEQVTMTTQQLTEQTEAKCMKQRELDDARAALESITEECNRLRTHNEEMQVDLNERTERRSWMEGLQAELETTNARNVRLETENRNLRWEACRVEEMRQRGESLEADAREVMKSREELTIRADTIEVLRTELEALTLSSQQSELNHREQVQSLREELSLTRGALDDARMQCVKALHDAQDLSTSNLKLRVQADSKEAEIRQDRASLKELRGALSLAKQQAAAMESNAVAQSLNSMPLSAHSGKPPHANALDGPGQKPGPAHAELAALRKKVEVLADERERLQHELDMCRETIRHNTDDKAPQGSESCLVRFNGHASLDSTSSSQHTPAAIAAQLKAHAAHISELQEANQMLEAERDEAARKLDMDKEISAQRVINLRKEVIAVQRAATEDKERALKAAERELQKEVRLHEETQRELAELGEALRRLEAQREREQARHVQLVEHMQEHTTSAASAQHKMSTKMQEEVKGLRQRHEEGQQERERYLRDYAELAGAVLQLAAWTCGEGDPRTVSASQQSVSTTDENFNVNGRLEGGLLSPSTAAMALKRGAAGAALGQTEQWAQVAAMVRGAGSVAATDLLEAGHDQLKSTLSDLLIWLNASNVGVL